MYVLLYRNMASCNGFMALLIRLLPLSVAKMRAMTKMDSLCGLDRTLLSPAWLIV